MNWGKDEPAVEIEDYRKELKQKIFGVAKEAIHTVSWIGFPHASSSSEYTSGIHLSGLADLSALE
ncbi:MAG: hypothetical protein R2941_07465 [Desulfobacterales bacterium]